MEIQSKNGYKINIKCFMPDICTKIIIACHGFGGDKESSAITLLGEKLQKHNIGVITFDFPGHGKSEVTAEKLTIDNCIMDLESLEDYISEKYPNTEIGIFATSFGAYIALLRINQGNSKYFSTVLRAPAICMDEIFVNALMQEDMETYKNRGYTVLGFDRIMNVPYSYYKELTNNKLFEVYKENKKMLIIQGTEDDVAPISDTKKFIKELNTEATLVEIPGADHRMKKEGELDFAIDEATKYILKDI